MSSRRVVGQRRSEASGAFVKDPLQVRIFHYVGNTHSLAIASPARYLSSDGDGMGTQKTLLAYAA